MSRIPFLTNIIAQVRCCFECFQGIKGLFPTTSVQGLGGVYFHAFVAIVWPLFISVTTVFLGLD